MPNKKKYRRKIRVDAKPQPLTNRVQLTPTQLLQVQGSAAEGLAARYNAQGKQSLELTRRLNLAKKRAKKFVLCTDQLGKRLYIGPPEIGRLTFEKSDALRFFYGFDKPEVKIGFYDKFFTLLKFQTQNV